MAKFSVITSVYKNDHPDYVRTALKSITSEQTRKPAEIVLVVDGPVSDSLAMVIKEYEHNPVFRVIWLKENKGLGNALRLGVEKAKYNICARMDSDDVSAHNRFAQQMDFLANHPETDIVGGQITEFIDTEDNVVANRTVPCTDE